jgi:hypothetical protein
MVGSSRFPLSIEAVDHHQTNQVFDPLREDVRQFDFKISGDLCDANFAAALRGGFQRLRWRSPIPLVGLWAVWVRVDEIESIYLVQGRRVQGTGCVAQGPNFEILKPGVHVLG